MIKKLKNGEPLHPSYNLGGNRIRFNDSLVFSPDFTWHDELPKFSRFCFPLLLGLEFLLSNLSEFVGQNIVQMIDFCSGDFVCN